VSWAPDSLDVTALRGSPPQPSLSGADPPVSGPDSGGSKHTSEVQRSKLVGRQSIREPREHGLNKGRSPDT
jgi:hypothetical protein